MTIAAIGLNLTLGYAGQVSLAQGAFVGIGAYAAALLTTHGWPLGCGARRRGRAVLRDRLAARLSGAARAAPLSRLRDARLLDPGLPGVPQRGMAHRAASTASATSRARRCSACRRSRPLPFYYFCLGILALVSLALWWLVRSPWGRAFMALRENPVRALSLGVDTRRYTLMAFAIGSALGGVAGALYAPLVQFIDPTPFALVAVAQPAADGDRRRLGLLLRAVPRRGDRGAAARMAALHRGLLPDALCRRGDGAAGYSPTGILGVLDRFCASAHRPPRAARGGAATLETAP